MNETFREWADVNQRFELNYQKCYNYRDFDDFEKQWKDIFTKFGLHKESFNNKVLLDIGCGSRPALSYFSSNNEKHCMAFKCIGRVIIIKFSVRTSTSPIVVSRSYNPP